MSLWATLAETLHPGVGAWGPPFCAEGAGDGAGFSRGEHVRVTGSKKGKSPVWTPIGGHGPRGLMSHEVGEGRFCTEVKYVRDMRPVSPPSIACTSCVSTAHVWRRGPMSPVLRGPAGRTLASVCRAGQAFFLPPAPCFLHALGLGAPSPHGHVNTLPCGYGNEADLRVGTGTADTRDVREQAAGQRVERCCELRLRGAPCLQSWTLFRSA